MTEKVMEYKTLKGLINATRDFNLNHFLSGQFCHKKNGWCRFKLTDALDKEIENKFKSVIGDFNRHRLRQYGIFNRVVINKYGRAEYQTGQCYKAEMRTIRNIINE